jgi:RHS repeat-associated protein
VAESYGEGSDGRTFAGGRVLGDFVVLGARVYDPEIGRFISPDPALHPLNPFAYTLGNPLTFWDPGGLSAEVVSQGNPVEVSRTAARVSSSLGSLLLSSAAHARSIPLALLGVGFLVLAGLASLVRLYFENRMPSMEVFIEDLPSGSGVGGINSGETSPAPSDLEAVACSPVTIGQGRKTSLGAALLVPLQMLLAGLWVAWLRRRGPGQMPLPSMMGVLVHRSPSRRYQPAAARLPPSQCRVVPVTHWESELARKTAQPAVSLGRPKRPRGIQ